jgi:hypothetical protein
VATAPGAAGTGTGTAPPVTPPGSAAPATPSAGATTTRPATAPPAAPPGSAPAAAAAPRAGGAATRPVTASDLAPSTAATPPAPPPAAFTPLRPAPADVAVSSPSDILVALADGLVLVDPADPLHPFFFDHPSDHVPGMALLEAARQSAALASGGRLLRPVGARLRALRFTEARPAAVVECVDHGLTCVFRVRQGGGVTACGVLRYGARPGA